MIRIISALMIIGTITGCNSPEHSKSLCNVVSGKNVSTHSIRTIRGTEIIKVYKTGRRIDSSNPNIMHEAGQMYVINRSPSWNLRPNIPLGDPAFKNHLRPVNIHNKNMEKQKVLLRNTNKVMRRLGNQMQKNREEIQKMSSTTNSKDFKPQIEKLKKEQADIIRKLAEFEPK